MLEQATSGSINRLFDQGLLGVFVVLLLIGLAFAGLVIRFLYQEGRKQDAQSRELLERVVTVLEGAKAANASLSAALESLKGTADANRRAIEGTERLIETTSTEIRHAIANQGQILGGIVDILRRHDRGAA